MDTVMTFDWKKIDPDKIMRLVLLRPRKISETEKRHGTFNRRMIAASFDSMLLTILVAPVVDYFFMQAYGVPNIEVQQIAAHAAQERNSSEAIHAFLDELHSSGLFERLVTNLKWQYYALCIYAVVCWHFWAATPGKILCGLKIVDAKTGGPMGSWQSIMRVMGYFISALPFGLGFFWIWLNKKRRGWHDYLAGTMVVRCPIKDFMRQKSIATVPTEPEVESTSTSTPESAPPSGSPAPSAGE